MSKHLIKYYVEGKLKKGLRTSTAPRKSESIEAFGLKYRCTDIVKTLVDGAAVYIVNLEKEVAEVKKHTTLYIEIPEGTKDVGKLCKQLDSLSLDTVMNEFSVEVGDSHWEENT